MFYVIERRHIEDVASVFAHPGATLDVIESAADLGDDHLDKLAIWFFAAKYDRAFMEA